MSVTDKPVTAQLTVNGVTFDMVVGIEPNSVISVLSNEIACVLTAAQQVDGKTVTAIVGLTLEARDALVVALGKAGAQ